MFSFREVNVFLFGVPERYTFIERTNETGILVSLDQEKASNPVDRSFLLNILELFGFAPVLLQCTKVSYMQVLVNDFLSDPILPER